jgi:hypothetical protein
MYRNASYVRAGRDTEADTEPLCGPVSAMVLFFTH